MEIKMGELFSEDEADGILPKWFWFATTTCIESLYKELSLGLKLAVKLEFLSRNDLYSHISHNHIVVIVLLIVFIYLCIIFIMFFINGVQLCCNNGTILLLLSTI